MKRVFIIHRWSGTPNDDWRAWLKKELEKKGYKVFIPIMPETDYPKIDKWVSEIDKTIGIPDENTYFIAHSIGAQAVMRYLDKFSEKFDYIKIPKIIFVAGWFKLDNLEEEGEDIVKIAQPWIENPIDLNKIRNICSDVKVLLSNNEPFGFVDENKNIFEKELNANVQILDNKGHFTEDDGIVELPELLDFFK